MEMIGEIDPQRPLLVVAVHEEAEHLTDLDLPCIVTGAGKVNAAVATAWALRERRPGEVVNLGTAGGLRDGLDGIHVIGTVIQHDLDDAALIALTGRSFSPAIELGQGPILATGDRFVADSNTRDALAEHAELVDMEGYGVAHAGAIAGVPVRLVKLVSDRSDEDALKTWAQTIGDCADELAVWARDNL